MSQGSQAHVGLWLKSPHAAGSLPRQQMSLTQGRCSVVIMRNNPKQGNWEPWERKI